MKILIVEDSATLRHAMCNCVSSAGHEPIVAESGEKALQIVDTTTVDMVVMDVEMPGLDGFETTRLIREWFGEFWVPIIFVTGKNEENDLRQGIDAGGDDYLIKPVSETILLAKIRAMERITQMRDQLNTLNKELTILSERDSLTKLYNRRTFEERAMEHWRQAARSKESLAILLLDIDHFKLYNDCYGHIAGDDCIVKVAEAIQTTLSRPGDLCARYGGEEFIVMLPTTDEDGAGYVAEKIRRAVQSLHVPHRESTTHDRVTISVGGAVIGHTAGNQLVDLINAADKALYSAKLGGRNRVRVKPFNPKTLVLIASGNLELSSALDGHLANHSTLLQALNGDQALDAAQSNHADLIVLDMTLPGLGAKAVLETLRQKSNTLHTPIILLADPQDKIKRAVEQYHIETVITKPFESSALVEKINTLLF